jgi:mannose-6-phosphate isomerase-like protein (cupin superfamily)
MAQMNPRVVITSHKPDGTSFFTSDRSYEAFEPFGPAGSSFAVFDVRNTVPVSNQEPGQGSSQSIPRCPPGGTIFSIANFPPECHVPMHRTLSLDYCIVMSGEIVLRLDGGEEKTVKAGEFIVQGGTNHTWLNRTSEVCRVAFVMVGAEELQLGPDSALEEAAIKK